MMRKIKVANTGWELHYQYADSASSAGLALIAGIIVFPALLALLAFFMGYRKLSDSADARSGQRAESL